MTEPSDGWQNPEDDSIYTNTTSAKCSSIPEKAKTTKSEDALSVFSKGKCGEPLPAQLIQLNFTLDKEDNEYQLDDSIYTDMTSAKWSSIPEKAKTTKSEDALSVFSEGECGEPLPAQHIQLNFTLDEEDNEYQQQKCCDFWSFIHSLPQIKHLNVKPVNPRKSIENPCPSVSESAKSEVEIKTEDAVAVSMLERIQNEGMLGYTFGTKMPQSICSISSGKHKELGGVQQRRKKKMPGSCPCTQATCPCKPTKQKDVLRPLKIALKEMQEWDAKHPKDSDMVERFSCDKQHVLCGVFELRMRQNLVLSIPCMLYLLRARAFVVLLFVLLDRNTGKKPSS